MEHGGRVFYLRLHVRLWPPMLHLHYGLKGRDVRAVCLGAYAPR